MYVAAVILAKCSDTFEHLGSTLWLFATVGVYTFGAPVISELFLIFPCFEGADETRMMVRILSSSPSNEGLCRVTILSLNVMATQL